MLFGSLSKEVVVIMHTVETVTLSPEFQITIPPKTCESVGLRSGAKLEMIVYDDRIELIPTKRMKSFRGIAKGINTNSARETDRL